MNDQQLQECKDELAICERRGIESIAIPVAELRRLLDCIAVYDRLQQIRCGA